MTGWSEDAADEALNAFAEARERLSDSKAMMVALNVATTYEGVFPTSYVTEIQKDSYLRGRAEALEEAVAVVLAEGGGIQLTPLKMTLAAAVRALKSQPPTETQPMAVDMPFTDGKPLERDVNIGFRVGEPRPPIYPAEWVKGGE